MTSAGTELVNGAPASFTSTLYTYDSMGRLSAVEQPISSTASDYSMYTYDPAGNLLTVKTGYRKTGTQLTNTPSITSYTYDQAGRPLTMTDPLGKKETYTYDLNGNMLTKTDRKGTVTQYQYDNRGRLTAETIGTGEDAISRSRTYGLNGSLLSLSENGATVNYTYDALGRLITETAGGFTKSYGYNIGDFKTSFTVKKGNDTKTSQTFTYDDLGQLASVSGNGVSATYTYDANGNLASAALGNGVARTYSYNQSNQITQMTAKKGSTVLSSYSYGYDLAGRRISASDSGKTTQYAYDLPGRLATETTPEETTSFTYDARGNRLTSTAGGVTTAYTYDLANRLLTSAANGVTTTYTYDDNGNTLSAQKGTAAAKQYSYNAANQLTGYTDPAESIAAAYTYQPDGLRKSKTVGGITTDFVWDGQQLALEETGGASTVYIRGLQLIAQIGGASASDALYYLHDGHGSVTHLTNSAGAITSNYQYDAFGNQENSTGDGNPFRYCGEYTDACSGLVYLRNRYYDPATGRFINEDPIKDGDNWYVYCGNNPVMFKDPSGYLREPGYVNGVWCEDPDAYEFKKDSGTYKILVDLGNRWINGTVTQRREFSALAEKVRRLAREGTPIEYAQDKIMDELHKNAKEAQDYQATMSKGLPGTLYQVSGGNYFMDSATFLIGMAYGDWNYKYDSKWQVRFNPFDGKNMDVDHNKNWIPWMYFDGMLVSADKFGNINLAYVGVKMKLPYWVFQNFATTDKDDGFWIQYGIDMAEQGR